LKKFLIVVVEGESY